MKAKKQWMSLLGAVMMAATLVFPAAQTVKAADRPVVSATVGNVTGAEVGDIISLPITFTSGTANLVGIHGELTTRNGEDRVTNYDSTVLSYQGTSYDDGIPPAMTSEAGGNFGYVGVTGFGSGTINVKFKVLKCSEKPVTVTIKNLYFTSGSPDFLDGASVELTSTVTINHPQDQQKVVETPATCQSAGHKTVTCGLCGATLEDEDLPMTAHSWGEWEYLSSDDEPTCTKVGVQHRKCTVCQTVDTETKEVPMVDHKYEWTTEKEATCTEKGVEKGICSVCEATTTREIPAKGHTWKIADDTDKDGWKVVTEATKDKEGSKERVCSVCEEKETAVIAKLTPTPTTTPSGKTDSKTSGTTNKTSGTTSKTSGTKSSTTSTGTAVKTGDTFAPVLYVGLILAAACGITGSLVVKRRKNH